MNLQQLRFLQEAARRQLNLTEVARALNTSQPGVSRAIMELESELGIEVFSRHGKRLRHITEPGKAVLQSVEIILREVANLRRIGQHFSAQDHGTLLLAATHTQARYVLPQAVSRMTQLYPQVCISMQQGTPEQVAHMLLDESAEIGIATESLAQYDSLITLPCYEWQHMVVTPKNHALAQLSRVHISDLAEFALITYNSSFTGRSRIDAAFAQAEIAPRIALEAIDSDVIKTYVRLGLGVGIVAEMAVQEASEDLHCIPAGHLFGPNTTRVAFKRGVYLRDFVLHFAELLSARLNAQLIRKLTTTTQDRYEL